MTTLPGQPYLERWDEEVVRLQAEIKRLREVPAALRERELGVAMPDSISHGQFRAGYLSALDDVEKAISK